MTHDEQVIMKMAEEIRMRSTANQYKGQMAGALGGAYESEGKYDQCATEAVRPVPDNGYITQNHAPTPEGVRRIETVRAAARFFMDTIDANCPRCADASDAKRKVREAMMAANASIALNGAV